MARQRKNATFTLDKTYGSGHGDRTLLKNFYVMLNQMYPDTTLLPLPPESHVHPAHDAKTQAFILVDFAVRKIAPIAADDRAALILVELEELEPATNKTTAAYVAEVFESFAENFAAEAAASLRVAITAPDEVDAAAAVRHALTATVVNCAIAAAADVAAATARGARHYLTVGQAAAEAAYFAAKVNPDATWAAVNEMLQAL